MKLTSWTRKLLTAAFLSVAALTGGCDDGTGSQTDDITDIDNSTVERQSIGNCWLYAEASWAESMHLDGDGREVRRLAVVLDLLALVPADPRRAPDEIETGGFFSVSRRDHPRARPHRPRRSSSRRTRRARCRAARRRPSRRSTPSSRRASSRTRLALQPQARPPGPRRGVAALLDGEGPAHQGVRQGLRQDLRHGRTSPRRAPRSSRRRTSRSSYAERLTNPNKPTDTRTRPLDVAIDEWNEANYPTYGDSSKRNFQIRVQKALHDAQPVVITWNVDFNAMESGSGPGAQGLVQHDDAQEGGRPGRQGGHMTVLEDYEATTKEFGELKAGVTLDPRTRRRRPSSTRRSPPRQR
jgi:hypothetical protein